MRQRRKVKRKSITCWANEPLTPVTLQLLRAKGRTPAYNILTSRTTPSQYPPTYHRGLRANVQRLWGWNAEGITCMGFHLACNMSRRSQRIGDESGRHYGFSSFSSGVPFASQVMAIGSHRRKPAIMTYGTVAITPTSLHP
jgi:hypothetical protein